ncbi:MAG TPA: ribonuclease HI family protein [Patescibacteria group bacterium]|nr:ribonuclease HI family protein [Patescibacteria group bacterium]
MTLEVYIDGGSKGNPGPSSIGMVFYRAGKKIFAYREDIGMGTNNRAEYTALVRALEKIKNQKSCLAGSSRCEAGRRVKIKNTDRISEIKSYSDSRLLVNQVNGLFRVKNAAIREFIFAIRTLEQEIGIPISYHLIQREKNTEADALVNGKG